MYKGKFRFVLAHLPHSELTKEYKNSTGGSKLAVDKLDLTMYSGQITALLGHNGAGKVRSPAGEGCVWYISFVRVRQPNTHEAIRGGLMIQEVDAQRKNKFTRAVTLGSLCHQISCAAKISRLDSCIWSQVPHTIRINKDPQAVLAEASRAQAGSFSCMRASRVFMIVRSTFLAAL